MPNHTGRLRSAVVLACLVGAGVASAACGSRGVAPGAGAPGSAPRHHGREAPGAAARRVTISSGPVATPSAAHSPGSVTVADAAGDHFVVEAAAVNVSVAVNVDGFLWSAAPGQDFLVDQLTVANPTATSEPLGGFDDVDTGLADDVAFVMRASDASGAQYSADCGVDAAFPPALCPMSYGEGITVDSDSLDHDDHSALTLPGGASAQITYSYGPVLQALSASSVSAYFTGDAAPVDLTP